MFPAHSDCACELDREKACSGYDAGVEWLYVHVVHDNEAALKLYLQAGFTVECEETTNAARAAGRDRRLLLVQSIAADNGIRSSSVRCETPG
jgi:ribosomal protein S18 acetylase RimI-like enzyme